MTDAQLAAATMASYYEQLTPENRAIVGHLTLSLLKSQPQQPSPFNPADHLQEWLLSLTVGGIAPSTAAQYHHYLRNFMRQANPPTAQGITRFLATCPPASLNNALAALHSFFRFSRRMGYIGADPCEEIPTPKQSIRVRSAPPAEHLAAFMAALSKPRDRALFLVLFDTGARISEALTAPRSAFNAAAGTLMVTGKRDKQRILHLHPRTIEAMVTHLTTLPPETPWIFHGRDHKRPADKRAAEELMGRICQRAGVPHYTPHQIRHAYATTMLSRGASLAAVSRSMGHATPSVTANVYWHIMGESEVIDAHDKYGPLATAGERRP